MAILAADVAGYGRLVGADDEGTLAQWKAHFRELIEPKIAEHHGRIVRITGDGLLVEFVSVIAALKCAVEVQHGMGERNIDVPLEIVYDPYREVSRPILRYIDEIDARWDNDIVTVIIPEFVVDHWWGHLLHNQTALLLKGRLLFRKGTVVTSLPYHLHEESRDGDAK